MAQQMQNYQSEKNKVDMMDTFRNRRNRDNMRKNLNTNIGYQISPRKATNFQTQFQVRRDARSQQKHDRPPGIGYKSPYSMEVLGNKPRTEMRKHDMCTVTGKNY